MNPVDLGRRSLCTLYTVHNTTEARAGCHHRSWIVEHLVIGTAWSAARSTGPGVEESGVGRQPGEHCAPAPLPGQGWVMRPAADSGPGSARSTSAGLKVISGEAESTTTSCSSIPSAPSLPSLAGFPLPHYLERPGTIARSRRISRAEFQPGAVATCRLGRPVRLKSLTPRTEAIPLKLVELLSGPGARMWWWVSRVIDRRSRPDLIRHSPSSPERRFSESLVGSSDVDNV